MPHAATDTQVSSIASLRVNSPTLILDSAPPSFGSISLLKRLVAKRRCKPGSWQRSVSLLFPCSLALSHREKTHRLRTFAHFRTPLLAHGVQWPCFFEKHTVLFPKTGRIPRWFDGLMPKFGCFFTNLCEIPHGWLSLPRAWNFNCQTSFPPYDIFDLWSDKARNRVKWREPNNSSLSFWWPIVCFPITPTRGGGIVDKLVICLRHAMWYRSMVRQSRKIAASAKRQDRSIERLNPGHCQEPSRLFFTYLRLRLSSFRVLSRRSDNARDRAKWREREPPHFTSHFDLRVSGEEWGSKVHAAQLLNYPCFCVISCSPRLPKEHEEWREHESPFGAPFWK